MIPLPSLVVTLLLRNHMSYRSYKSKRANSARSGKTDAETDGMSRGPTQNVSARQGPMQNFPPQRANAPDAHARKDRCQNRPYVQRTHTMRSLGKTDAQPPSASKGKRARCASSGRPMPKQTTRPEDQRNVFARQEPMHNSQCVRSARTDAQLQERTKLKRLE